MSAHPYTPRSIVERFESAQNSLVLQSSDLSLETIANMTESGAIDTHPKYQRRERWTQEAESALIESFLLNVPVPPVYLAEENFGTYSVIDGKQRLTAIQRYLKGKFALSKLEKYKEVESLKFNELPPALQNALAIRPYLRVVTLLKQTDPELKYEVFTRLNTGGQPLLPQEIRNALYRGPLNDLLFNLSENEFLRQQLKIKNQKESSYTEMADVEMTLRFFTLSEEWKTFSGHYRRSMDSFMKNNVDAKASSLEAMEKKFSLAISRCEKLWGEDAFKRYSSGAIREQFLAAVYDSQMLAASELSSQQYKLLLSKRVLLKKRTAALFDDPVFEQAVRVNTNTPSKVFTRVDRMAKMLKAIA